MTNPLGKYRPPRLSGDEKLPAGARLRDFWRWLGRNLVVNTTRGALAEYLVALALDAVDGLQEPWASYDLVTADGIRVEVKSSSYVQSWPQNRRSTPRFDIAPSDGWDPDTGDYLEEKKRWSDVYVFCLLDHENKGTLDPLDMDQWTFFVLSTVALDEKVGDQQGIGVGPLGKLEPREVPFDDLADAVREEARRPRGQRVS